MMFPMGFGPMASASQWEKKPEPASHSGLHFFFHSAMACDWSIRIPDEEHGGHSLEYAQQAAEAAWEEVNRLEAVLSRFRDTSDITQINARAGSGEWASIGMDAWECLSWALEVARQTDGAFDVALGQVLEERRLEDNTFAEGQEIPDWPGPLVRFLELEDDPLRARLGHPLARLDLGAIGKGYALDGAANVLREWSIESALLHSGQSSVVAIVSAPENVPETLPQATEKTSGGWSVELRAPWNREASVGGIVLRNAALGGSGRAAQGYHIVDPRTGRGARAWQATWVACPGFASLADALSTAFMVLSGEEITEFCRDRPQISVLAWRDDEVLALGESFKGLEPQP